MDSTRRCLARNKTPVVYTPRTQEALCLARKEAVRFGHNFVGTEHVFLGLLALSQGTSATILNELKLDFDRLRKEIEEFVGFGGNRELNEDDLPETPFTKRALQGAASEARGLGHIYIGTGHLFLGLLREGGGFAGMVLSRLGLSFEELRRRIFKELADGIVFTKENEADTCGVAPREEVLKAVAFPQFEPTTGLKPLAPSAEQVLRLAQDEALLFRCSFVGTEHLLLGLLAFGTGTAVTVLSQRELGLDRIRSAIEQGIGGGDGPNLTITALPTPRLLKVIRLAAEEAYKLNHPCIGTGHLLLGLLIDSHNVACRVLQGLKPGVEEMQRQVLVELEKRPKE